MLAQRLEQTQQPVARARQAGVDLVRCERLDQHRAAELELRREIVVIGQAATDDQLDQAVLASKLVDRLQASAAVLGHDLVQPIQQRQELLIRDPGLTNLVRHVVARVELIDQPCVERSPLLSPGRERKDDRERMLTTGSGCCGSLVARRRRSWVSSSSKVVLPEPGSPRMSSSLCSVSKTSLMRVPGDSVRCACCGC